jgi:phosphoribosyl-ATP pyrophosphohydrolase
MTTPSETGDVWRALEAVVQDRLRTRPAGSYVVELVDGGHAALASKVIEEAYELIEACGGEEAAAITHEAADLAFHVLLLLQANGIAWRDVENELSRRFGIGGLAEKAARTQRPVP